MISCYICMQQEQSNRYLQLQLWTFELFQITIAPSPLKHFLRTKSNDAWPLIEFTPCEKQKYQVTFVIKNKCVSIHLHTTSPLILFQTSRLISSKTKILGNCEEELPKKPVGRWSAVCRPTVDRQLAVCRPTDGRQTADRFCPKYRLPVGDDCRPTVGNVSVSCR